MRSIYPLLILLLSLTTIQAQENLYKQAWLEKWQNSKAYLIAIAEEMPDSLYDYKPTEREMSFEEQLQHINGNMEWLATTYFDKPEAEVSTATNSKERIIANLASSFDLIFETIKAYPEARFAEPVDFFAGEKSRLQILNLLQDHITHHRGQLIVYLNLNALKPPQYTGW
ncbi:DinB family protein [Leeuwenhoekiella parthenopeia]|uniref:DinB family protein n=1 Tax=Leeuwenhoekiella parthenopeia TaxID=2890320 RepID=A0ABS8GQ80_9FLAO|nr:DinB family protein [Leeuwenhoekiella parthenopeia]MCC4212120.1 DinB family protein [Leeuwenhoekiella parthenopeia]